MYVVLRHRDSEYEVELSSAAGTVGEMVSPLFEVSDPVVAVDGRRIATSMPLVEAGIGNGVTIEVGEDADPRCRGRLEGVRGEHAGRTFALTPGALSIGAGPAGVVLTAAKGRVWLHADNSGGFSIRNNEQMVVLVDGSAVSDAVARVSPGSKIEIEGNTFRLTTSAPEATRRKGVFNRPPRHVVRWQPTRLEPPQAPPQPAKAMRFGWGALIVPVVLGIAMAILIHPRMAVFAVFSPVMLLANWVEDRRRVRRERRETGEVYREAIKRFGGEVADAYRREVEALHRRAVAPADLKARAIGGDSRLWERRRDHDDFMKLPIGTGCLPWQPQLCSPSSPEVASILRRFGELHDIPITIDLGAGSVTGMAGSRSELMRMARQIVLQAAVHHGPADLVISVFTERPGDWDWAKWLPHVVVDGSGRRRLASSDAEAARVADLLPEEEGDGRLHLVVVDLPDLVGGARASIRESLRDGKALGVAGIALAGRPLDLPSLSTTIISIEPTATRIRFPDGDGTEISPWRMSGGDARATARALSRIDDPEAISAGAALPGLVHLTSLLQLGEDVDRSIEFRWKASSKRVSAPIGIGNEGPLNIDLVADGPHALLGGTTGAGKSELLRTLVASLATTTGPDALNFVLIDYKGGSAFDVCAALPHTVGLVTDLDEHLAGRALTCLEAELRYREHRLREAGVSDISDYPSADRVPLPRLLVVIDEFAALAKELPDFIDALVGVAQRGRSLGVHLLLATQRPSGVISDNIKANTNLRIALRVQDNADSVDVIGCADAAAVGRGQPGRGLARLGPRDVVPFQTALVTSRSLAGDGSGTRCRPFVFAHEQPVGTDTVVVDDNEPSDLEQLVAAAERVAARLELPPARQPWPEALPQEVYLEELEPCDLEQGATSFGLADEPHRQRRVAASWSPGVGNLLLYGLPGSGTTSTLATLAVGLARNNDPDRLHVYVLDFDDQLLAPLSALPHVGAVVGVNEKERQLRLLRRLTNEVQQRRHVVATRPEVLAGYPTIVTMLDNYGGFADLFDDPGDMSIRGLFTRLVADGPGVGMFTIVTAKQPSDVPTRVGSLVGARLAFRLADRYDYSGLGVPTVDPPDMPGRAFETGSGREIQVALCHPDGAAAAVAAGRWGEPTIAPWSIATLPADVAVADVMGAGHISPDEWFLPLGIGDTALTPAGLILRDGEHALITGPARSGKSTALATVATVARAAHPGLRISAILPRRSPLTDCQGIDDVFASEDLGALGGLEGSHLLLIDDAELVGDCPFLADLIKSRRPNVRVVAAGSADAIRGLYGHWTQDIRRSRIGCALRPNVASDGDLWQTQLPRRGPERFPVGRGYLLADGQTELVQLGRK
jgi:S-DNA-T family DNA segregation ATPase FtsK/SpoIIIE